ncbi:MAG TPA: alpha/beta hydrolase [Anaerolineaceae bacterium]|nr:alpha/beta hydrolase [Anaerolineaceae bacterium]HPN51107.1 alpha/beta hydrolase [Anaerolineaceae bacterium]
MDLVLIILLLVVLALACGLGLFFASKIIYPHTFSYEQTRQWDVEAGKINEKEFDSWSREEILIPSPYGYNLYGQYFPLPGSKKTAIIAHGITYTIYGSVKYMKLFRNRGFNVLLYDHRNHGRSGGKNTTFGYYEKEDLKSVVDWALNRLGPGGKVGTHGESMGAAIVLQHAAIDPRLSFVVADCPFSTLEGQLTYRLGVEYHLPPFPMLNLADFFCWLQTGMKIKEVSPISAVRQFSTPLLLAHGKDDDYIPPAMSQALYDAKTNGLRQLYLAPNAKHAEAFWKNPVEYDQKVGEFLTQIGLN